MDVPLNYSGSGYPIAVLIFPKGGMGENEAYHSLVQRYAINSYMAVKNYISTAPNYDYHTSTYTESQTNVVATYKNSATDSTTYNRGGAYATAQYDDRNATNTVSGCVRIQSNTKMSVYIDDASYCFPVNIEYTYIVIYSA